MTCGDTFMKRLGLVYSIARRTMYRSGVVSSFFRASLSFPIHLHAGNCRWPRFKLRYHASSLHPCPDLENVGLRGL